LAARKLRDACKDFCTLDHNSPAITANAETLKQREYTPQFLIDTLGGEELSTVLSKDFFPHHAIIKLARQDPQSIFNAKVLVQGEYQGKIAPTIS
jgi:hypothetical protein